MARLFAAAVVLVAVLPSLASEPGRPLRWRDPFSLERFTSLTCTDADGDGYFYEGGCGTDPDCNDASASSHPGAAESCDGFDNDCDSTPDNSPDCHRQCSLPGELGSELRTTILEYSLEPKLAWTGSGFGLAWEDFQDGDYEIFFTVLDPGGLQISPVVQITNNSFPDFGPSLVWTGARFGLAWSGGQPEAYDIQFAQLAADGSPIGASTAVTTSPRNSMLPSLVWNGHGYGVAWYDYRDDPAGYRDDIYFARLDAVGNKIGSDVRVTATSTNAEYPSLAWSGTEYGLAWHDYRDPTPLCCSEIYFARLDSLGTQLGSQVRITNAAGFSAFPTLVSAGDGWAVVWEDDRLGRAATYFIHLNGSGSPSGVETLLSSTAGGSRPKVVWTGDEFVAVWSDDRYSPNGEIFLARVDGLGNVLSETRVMHAIGDSSNPVLAWTGSVFGLSWSVSSSDNSGLYFARIGCSCLPDGDGDQISSCGGDCDDTQGTVFPGAPQLCDSINNDCTDPLWPGVPVNEAVADSDGYRSCGGDCNEFDPAVHPGSIEICNGIDDNCNGPVDEDGQGVDADGDGVHNACDNCRLAYNPDQLDADGDHVGNACDDCVFLPNADQADADSDGRGNACDNCPAACNPSQDDTDHDGVGDVCDNCILDHDPDQRDFDHDGEGDLCDLNDGLLLILFNDPNYIEWQEEAGYTSWNVYEGDLDVLRGTGVYTQGPGSNPLAERHCGETVPWVDDFDNPPTGKTGFSLVTGVAGGVEGSLGQDSEGNERPNGEPCP